MPEESSASPLPQFLPGLELNRLFFQQIVQPLMTKHFPDLKFSAALMGEGSDVMGYDTPQSMDHNWGPRLGLFLTETDYKKEKEAIDQMLRKELPYEFMGFPTNFTREKETYLRQQMKPIKSGPVNHLIDFFTIKSFYAHYLEFDPYKDPMPEDWLSFPQQCLIEVSRGEIYYDGLGELEKIREKFRYFPEPVWLYIYMVQWEMIGTREAFMGRSGQAGDELGSNVIATEIINQIMRLCFLMEKTYFPYDKWFGTAFSRLRSAGELTHLLINVVQGKTWQERDDSLGAVYEVITRLHNELKLTKPMKVDTSNFHGRPFKTLNAYTFYEEIKKKLEPPFARYQYQLGSIDQYIGNPRIHELCGLVDAVKSFIK